jgi:long-chain fatty acid transport protein
MSRTKNHLVSAVSLLIGMAVSGQALASNGYFAIGYGTKSKGMGGVGIALPQDTMAPANNPAGGVFVGDRFDIGVNALKTQATVASTFEVKHDDAFQLIPHLGYNGMLDQYSSIGVSLYANDGIYSRFTNFEQTLEQGFANFSYAHKIGERSSLGGSILVAMQNYENNNLAYASEDRTTGVGLKFGWQGYVGGGVSLGATWQPTIRMSDASALSSATGLSSQFDIPATWGAGIAWNLKGFTLAFDYQRINYNDVATLGNPITDPSDPGLEWDSINVFKLGFQYEFNNLSIRAGFNHGDSPITETNLDLNALTPVLIQNHITAGLTAKFGQSSELNIALVYGLENTVSNATFESTQSQYAAEVSYGVRF